MMSLKLILISAFLISVTNEGSCAITSKVSKYTDCRDKRPTDERNNVCCYLKSGDFKRCVEMRRLDIKSDRFKQVKDSIKAGTYDYWLMDNYTGFDEYKTKSVSISKIDSLRCSNSQYLKYFGIFAILFFIF